VLFLKCGDQVINDFLPIIMHPFKLEKRADMLALKFDKHKVHAYHVQTKVRNRVSQACQQKHDK
jgi:hypothetical protein